MIYLEKTYDFTVEIADDDGKIIGKIDNVLAENQEQANRIVLRLIESGVDGYGLKWCVDFLRNTHDNNSKK